MGREEEKQQTKSGDIDWSTSLLPITRETGEVLIRVPITPTELLELQQAYPEPPLEQRASIQIQTEYGEETISIPFTQAEFEALQQANKANDSLALAGGLDSGFAREYWFVGGMLFPTKRLWFYRKETINRAIYAALGVQYVLDPTRHVTTHIQRVEDLREDADLYNAFTTVQALPKKFQVHEITPPPLPPQS